MRFARRGTLAVIMPGMAANPKSVPAFLRTGPLAITQMCRTRWVSSSRAARCSPSSEFWRSSRSDPFRSDVISREPAANSVRYIDRYSSRCNTIDSGCETRRRRDDRIFELAFRPRCTRSRIWRTSKDRASLPLLHERKLHGNPKIFPRRRN